jgi:hypothetical protein
MILSWSKNQFINISNLLKMKSKVKVTADKAGNVISVSKNNPDFGHIRVEQSRMVINDKTGFATSVRISALIPGEVEALASFGFTANQELPGVIYVKEQTKPFDAKTPERDLKIAGTTGVICRIGDQEIYRKNFYSVNPDKADETIEHTNPEEIQEAYAKLKESALAPNEEFNV